MTPTAGKGKKESAETPVVAKTVDTLAFTGMPKGIARTLAYLSTQEDWATSKDIERGTRLRQPEVSISVRSLVERGWVERDNLRRDSKGRPVNIYRMSTSLVDIYREILDHERSKISQVESNMDQLRDLWSVK